MAARAVSHYPNRQRGISQIERRKANLERDCAVVGGRCAIGLRLGVSACGGTSDAGQRAASAWSPTRRPRRPTRRSSRPSRRPTTARASASSSPTAPPATRPARSRPASTPTSSRCRSHPTSTSSSRPKYVADDWNKDEYDGFVTNSVVVFAVRKGNPKNIKTWDDLIKDGVEVIDAEPVHLGRREVEHHGRLRGAARAGQVRAGRGQEYLRQLFDNVPVQDKSAREALQTFVGGKGDVLLAYENEAITAQQKGEDVDYVVPDETILIQNPIAVTTTEAPGGQGVRRLRALRRGAEDLRREGLPLGERRTWSTKTEYPTPPNLFEITKSAAGRRSTRSSSTPTTARRRDREGPREFDRVAGTYDADRQHPGRRACPGCAFGVPRPSGAALGRGIATGYLSLIVLIPLAAVIAKAFEDGLGTFWTAVTSEQAVAGAEADADRLADRRGDQRRHGHADRLGARARRVPRQVASSTR